jgi:hypothetical protein
LELDFLERLEETWQSFFPFKLVQLPFNIDSNYQGLENITGLSGISASKRRPIIT